MKTKIKTPTLIMLSTTCLLFLTSFFASNPHNMPAAYVLCDLDSIVFTSNSTFFDFWEEECTVCELVRVERKWDTMGLLEGTLYTYDEGSEPAIWYEVDCTYSREPESHCTKYTVDRLGNYCSDIWVPCSEEDQEECSND